MDVYECTCVRAVPLPSALPDCSPAHPVQSHSAGPSCSCPVDAVPPRGPRDRRSCGGSCGDLSLQETRASPPGTQGFSGEGAPLSSVAVSEILSPVWAAVGGPSLGPVQPHLASWPPGGGTSRLLCGFSEEKGPFQPSGV